MMTGVRKESRSETVEWLFCKGGDLGLEIYVHIPFCIRKCAYCDFLSGPADEKTKKSYAEAVRKEIAAVENSGEQVVSVFFGGGTPSALPAEELTRILNQIKSRFTLCENAEISLEANPGTVTEEKLLLYRKAGFNRISFGCQSMNDIELRHLGRIHTAEEFLESYRLARKAGFSNINVDLMSGLPGQSFVDWEDNLKRVAELGPEHISAYSLILEEGTPFFENMDTLDLPDEETERLMYEKTHEILKAYAYDQYEISNYAKKGYACRHNVGYWKRAPYLGIGLGAASLVDECRYSNTSDMEQYLKNSGTPSLIHREIQKLSLQEQMEEFMILGLRMCEGISEHIFYDSFGKKVEEVYGDVIEKYCSMGLLKREDGFIACTRRGISVSNTIFADFLL